MADHLYPDREQLCSTLTTLFRQRRETVRVYADMYPADDVPSFSSLDAFRSVVPLVSKQDLLDDGKALSPLFPSRLPDAAATIPTAGTAHTTGVVPYNRADFDRHAATFAERQSRITDRTGEPGRVMVLGLTPMPDVLAQWWREAGTFAVAGPPDDPRLVHQLITQLSISYLHTTAAQAVETGKELDASSRERLTIIEVSGAPLSAATQDTLSDLYPNATIRYTYGLPEAGFASQPCLAPDTPSSVHPLPDTFLYEVIDPETEKPCGVGEQGELVLTSLMAETGMPLMRYRTGRLVRFEEATCDCSRSPLTFTVAGRVHFDRIQVGQYTLFRERFEDALRSASDIIDPEQYQLLLDETDGRVSVTLRAVPRTGITNDEGAKRAVRSKVMAAYDLGPSGRWTDAAARDEMPAITVSLVDSIPEHGGRAQRIIDTR